MSAAPAAREMPPAPANKEEKVRQDGKAGCGSETRACRGRDCTKAFARSRKPEAAKPPAKPQAAPSAKQKPAPTPVAPKSARASKPAAKEPAPAKTKAPSKTPAKTAAKTPAKQAR